LLVAYATNPGLVRFAWMEDTLTIEPRAALSSGRNSRMRQNGAVTFVDITRSQSVDDVSSSGFTIWYAALRDQAQQYQHSKQRKEECWLIGGTHLFINRSSLPLQISRILATVSLTCKQQHRRRCGERHGAKQVSAGNARCSRRRGTPGCRTGGSGPRHSPPGSGPYRSPRSLTRAARKLSRSLCRRARR
jgi:hypothetical protein